MEVRDANNKRCSSIDPIASAWSTRRRDRWDPDGVVYHARHRHLPANGLLHAAVRHRGPAHRTATINDLPEARRLLLCPRSGAPRAGGPPAMGGALGPDLWPACT